jgi:hypothetical protein
VFQNKKIKVHFFSLPLKAEIVIIDYLEIYGTPTWFDGVPKPYLLAEKEIPRFDIYILLIKIMSIGYQ